MEGKKILIVDDEQDVLTVLEKRLTTVGYSILKADNGKDAINIAKKEKPDLVILDVIMPEMGGVEVATVLKKDPVTKNIPVMFLTCLITKKEEHETGHDIGGQFFFAKPYNPNELLGEVERHIKSKS